MLNLASSSPNAPVAVLYQAQTPPVINGIVKPMKPGGYSDSGADIAFALRQAGVPVVTPVAEPNPSEPLDWVFPDTQEGIDHAVALGAGVLWLNTILFRNHPIETYLARGGWVVGQHPANVEKYDDKWETNQLLESRGLPIPQAIIINTVQQAAWQEVVKRGFSFPVVAKPIRGRGSAGVTLVASEPQLAEVLTEMLTSLDYGDSIMVEAYLSGQEVTLTIMPPGIYQIDGLEQRFDRHWSLPPVKRFNHQNGVAPYNGTVAVITNSQVLDQEELATSAVQQLMPHCERAAAIVGAKAPIRIDCRQNKQGIYYLFDLNMKPNMTGAGRPGRDDQDSLSALAARSIGWTYTRLLLNLLRQVWRQEPSL